MLYYCITKSQCSELFEGLFLRQREKDKSFIYIRETRFECWTNLHTISAFLWFFKLGGLQKPLEAEVVGVAEHGRFVGTGTGLFWFQ